MTITSVKREADRTLKYTHTPYGSMTLPKIPQEIFKFDSRSEAVCAIILERYVPNWQINTGTTWQIPLPLGKFADFRINNTIVEFHPIDLKHEMRASEFWKYKQKMAKIHPRYARDFEDQTKADKCNAYTSQRKELLALSIDLRHCALEVCCNNESFAKAVAKLTRNKIPPEEILEQWNQCFKEL